MIGSILQEAWDFVTGKLYAIWHPVMEFMFIAEWYAIGGIIILCVFVICFFLPFTWLRVIGGWIFTLVVAALAFGTFVFKHMRAEEMQRIAAEKKKTVEKKSEPWRPW